MEDLNKAKDIHSSDSRPEVTHVSEEPKHRRRAAASFLPKLLFSGLAVVIIVELIIGFRTLVSPTPVIGSKLQPLDGGQILLATKKDHFASGETVSVLIKESTGGHSVVGSDVSLKYDPTYLEATSSANFHRANIFGEFPIVTVDNKNGVIKISGIRSPMQGAFSGEGTFGLLEFKAKKEGATSLTINYHPNSTTESTIVDAITGKNILDATNGLSVTIGSGVSTQPASTQVCSQRVKQICQDASGRVGVQWCTPLSDNPFACSTGCFQGNTGFVPGCKVPNSIGGR